MAVRPARSRLSSGSAGQPYRNIGFVVRIPSRRASLTFEVAQCGEEAEITESGFAPPMSVARSTLVPTIRGRSSAIHMGPRQWPTPQNNRQRRRPCRRSLCNSRTTCPLTPHCSKCYGIEVIIGNIWEMTNEILTVDRPQLSCICIPRPSYGSFGKGACAQPKWASSTVLCAPISTRSPDPMARTIGGRPGPPALSILEMSIPCFYSACPQFCWEPPMTKSLPIHPSRSTLRMIPAETASKSSSSRHPPTP